MKWYSVSFTLLLLIFILGVVNRSESGKIVRAWRRNGHGRNGGSPRPYSPWSLFHRRQRMRRFRPMPHQHEKEHAADSAAEELPAFPFDKPSSEAKSTTSTDNRRSDKEASLLSPVRHDEHWIPSRRTFGNAIGRDPTFDYAPPSMERVKFISETQPQRRNARRPRPPLRRRRLPPGPPHQNKFQWNRRKTQYTRKPPLIWKLLNRQRWRRPPHGRPPPPGSGPRPNDVHSLSNSHENAEVIPYIPNIVFFQPGDMVPAKSNATILSPVNSTSSPGASSSSSSSTSSTPLLRPGKVTTVPLYPLQYTPMSEFKPIPSHYNKNKEFIFRVVELQTMKPSTTAAPFYKSVPSPTSEPTSITTTTQAMVSLPIIIVDPPKPIDQQINIDAKAEGSDQFLQVITDNDNTKTQNHHQHHQQQYQEQIPTTPMTTTTIPTTTSTTTTTTTSTTTTVKPIFGFREEPAIVEEIIVPDKVAAGSNHNNKKPSFQHLLPTYQSKTKPTVNNHKPPQLNKPSSITNSKEDVGSSIMITGIRSKVKEYKPQLLANFTQLLAFDKVIEPVKVITKPKPLSSIIKARSEQNASIKSESVRPTTTTTMRITTTKSSSPAEVESTSSSEELDSESSSPSPLEQFDPLKLIHSWFMKS